MIVNAELFVNDLPGQLIGSLEPISLVNGNILGVVHNREKIIDHRICVNVTFEVDDKRLEELKDHPDYFTPRLTDTPFEDLNRHNPIINGDNPDKKFLSRFI